jgi:hypothetical protein
MTGSTGEVGWLKWVTRKNALIDRIACAWLIKRFIDPEAELLFVPGEQVLAVAEREGATASHAKGAPLGGTDRETSFDQLTAHYGLTDPAMRLMTRIIHDADHYAPPAVEPEAAGVRGLALGFGRVYGDDDLRKIEAALPAYDALYAWCQLQAQQGREPMGG